MKIVQTNPCFPFSASRALKRNHSNFPPKRIYTIKNLSPATVIVTRLCQVNYVAENKSPRDAQEGDGPQADMRRCSRHVLFLWGPPPDPFCDPPWGEGRGGSNDRVRHVVAACVCFIRRRVTLGTGGSFLRLTAAPRTLWPPTSHRTLQGLAQDLQGGCPFTHGRRDHGPSLLAVQPR